MTGHPHCEKHLGRQRRRPSKAAGGELLTLLLHVPIFVKRPAPAPQAASPSPLVAAARTHPVSIEGVPDRITAVEEVLRRRAVGAAPETARVRLPGAQRAADAAEI